MVAALSNHPQSIPGACWGERAAMGQPTTWEGLDGRGDSDACPRVAEAAPN
jgi:hypothetical protein